MVAGDVEAALGLAVDVIVVPDEEMTAGARMLVEKKLTPPWDVPVHAWCDLSSDLPPAVVHRELFGDDGAFRAGPVDEEFDRRFDAMVRETDAEGATRKAEELDRYCFDEAKSLFLCAPQALYAVNRHVEFKAHRATFELADTEVGEAHWSRA